MTAFPIEAILPDVLRSLAAHSRLVLEAPPGAGKTTQVPPALLDASWLGGRKILMLEPRRIAARAAAEFMASQRGERVGETIGYRIRFESRVSAATRVEIITEGILTRMLRDDPELSGVGAILFDEFHERHLQGDLGAALALDVQATLRPDLRLVVMSATLDGDRVARWFDAPRLTSAGRSFPVRVAYPPPLANEELPFHARRVIASALAESDGDVLVFLPGKREIERMREVLRTAYEHDTAIELVALHGELALAEQHAALGAAASGVRRIVLATNVAESSLTLPGIRAVVDSGLAREPRFDPNSGFTRLETVAISQASADQRAGRAGRIGPGVCYRLWPQSRRLDASRTPEVAQVELSRLALELAVWGSGHLRWLDAPPAGALAQARDLLRALGAVDEAHRPTALGRAMLTFGAEPRLAAAVLRASPSQRAYACDLAALVEARNPLRGDGGRSDDFRLRVAALEAWRNRDARAIGVDRGAIAAIEQSARLWRRRAEDARAFSGQPNERVDPPLAAGTLLVHAFPDRIARQDPNDPRRYTLANGRGARVRDDSALFGERWLVALDLRFDERDSLILSGAPFDADVLARDFPNRHSRREIVRFDASARAVDAIVESRFGELVLERKPLHRADPSAIAAALVDGVRTLGLDALPWDERTQRLRTRVANVRAWLPELAFPDLGDTALLADIDVWLAPHVLGKSRLDSIAAATLHDALLARLDHTQRRALDELAPATIRVPSGMERAIAYADGQAPVLAVKLQELFGLADTPRIARGRVPLTLHLLSPAGRPIQVTQDLRSFWERTYPEVKRELKGRYSKHPWPDDPWTATPTARAKPRR